MPAFETDHYATLGLDRRCTAAQIRTAYRLLSKRHHPDVNGASAEAVERAQALNAAHEVLSDATRRRAYDRTLASAEPTAAPPAAKTQRDVAYEALLRVEEFFRGSTLQITVRDPAHPDGPETYTLVVPPGTAPGERFRLPRAAPFEGGQVKVRVKVTPGGRYKARGSDLRADLRISAARATSGGSEAIPAPAGGMLRVSIPAGVARGEILRIPRAGLPKSNGGCGDLLLKVAYRVPVQVTGRSGFRS